MFLGKQLSSRNVHEVFAEAKWIGVSLYVSVAVPAVMVFASCRSPPLSPRSPTRWHEHARRYNIIVVGGVTAVMYTGFGLSHSRPDVAYAMLSLCMLVAAGGAINFIMVPKILAIVRNEQVDIADLTTSHEMIKSSPSREQTPSIQPVSEPGSTSRLPSGSQGLSSVVL